MMAAPGGMLTIVVTNVRACAVIRCPCHVAGGRFFCLRGCVALSLALVLSLPREVPHTSFFEFVTYGVVLATLVGQGIAMRIILPRWSRGYASAEKAAHSYATPPG